MSHTVEMCDYTTVSKMAYKLLSQVHIPFISEDMNNDRTSWDDLSNEIILEIFDYLCFNDIYLGFNDLNIRLNSLIESYPHYFDFQSISNRISPNHIRSLKITQIFQLTLFASLNHGQLSSLRALSVSNLRPQQILDMFKCIELKQLEYIYLGVCKIVTEDNITIMASIQKQILSLGQYKLRRCHFKNNLVLTIDEVPKTLPSLNYLQIVGCENFYVLSQFLSRMPNLTHVQASTINQTERIPIPYNSYNITHLILRPHATCSAQELNSFFKNCCSSLKNLVIEIQIYRGLLSHIKFNKYQWLTMFPHRLINFHLKSPNHLWDFKMNIFQKPALQERILLISNDQQEYYCQVIIDAPFIDIWQQN